jgi:hypothetical protein
MPADFAITQKKGGTEVPPSLGRKRPRKQQSKLMLQRIIYGNTRHLRKRKELTFCAVQQCKKRNELCCTARPA